MSHALDEILTDEYLGDLSLLSMDELRARRTRCKEVETGLSYLRRVVQGHLDIIAAEQLRRADGGADGDLSGLIERLPAVLAENTRAPGLGRLTTNFDTGSLDDDLMAELDELEPHGDLSNETEVTDDALVTSAADLKEFEYKVSGLRRQLFDRIDAVEAEITRRYRSGEASVDTLLQ